MKPKVEEVLFLIDKYCEHDFDEGELCPLVRLNQGILENLIRDELKDKYYPGFVKYFKSNSKDCLLKSAKSFQRSIEARVKGNALFAKKEHSVDVHKEIWELYSTSIALAPIGSKELVLAYECRSNLLLHFKQYEDCVKDIDRVLSITDFDPLKVKMLCRKMTCFVAMSKDVVEKEHLWKVLKCHFEMIDDGFKNENFLKMIKQAKDSVCIEPNKKVKDEQECSTPLNSFSNIKLEKRCMKAKCDFAAGETVIVTKPTIASVNPNKFYAYCSYCLSFMWAGIPCDKCCLCMYCSEECKVKAWNKYHSLECRVNPHIDVNHVIYYDLTISLKIFLMGAREFGSVPKLLKKIKESKTLKNNFELMKTDELNDSKFLNLYTLPNKSKSDSCTISKLVKNTCFLMAYLTQTLSEIFEKEVGNMKGKELAKDEDFVYSTYVMLNIMMLCGLYMQFPIKMNRMDMCPKYENLTDCTIRRCCSIGSIFHFFKGLMEKSCNPNVSICKTQDGKIIYFCTKPIKEMEMISAALTVPFYLNDRMERLNLIKGGQQHSMYELCQCIACEKNWPPVMLELKKFQPKFYRRTSKVQTEGTELAQKYLSRLAEKGDPIKYFTYDADEFQELARDTNTVVNTCSQPSFASSLMMLTLSEAYEILYADPPLESHIPKDC